MAGLLSISEPNADSLIDDGAIEDSLINDSTSTIYSRDDIAQLFDLPLMDLLLQAQTIHREHFKANEVQISTLLSIKTG
ncbi:hypothetical protein R0J93_22440, partial [Pseudoalteromonas sp. SIMBA_148]